MGDDSTRDLMTIDQWSFMDRVQRTHINRFVQAYKKGTEHDPINFNQMYTADEWEYEYGLFIDVGGDAEDPL